jgi:hypothetical protein
MTKVEVPKDLNIAYQNFFLKSDAGKYFVAELDRQLNDHHMKSEDEPELSRDHSQRAKGLRGMEQHISSVIGGTSK